MEQRIALIPAYEPTETLAMLARQLLETGFRVVVVDDGSGSAYTPVFHALPAGVRLISYMPNRGKGRALKTAYRELMREGARGVVVTLDADGQHTVADAVRVCVRAAETPERLTLGVRAFGAGTPLRSRFGNAVTRAVYRLSTGVCVSDTQTGLRAFGTGLLPVMAEIAGERYEYEMNVLMECPRRGIAIREVPIETVYIDGNRGSHFHVLRDSFLIYRNIFRFAASSLLGFAVDYGLYSLLVTLTAGLGAASVPLSNVAARVVSASVNFTVNKRFVFRSRDSVLRTGAQYFALAACILAGNTLLLSALVNGLGFNRFAAKLVTEVTFFTFSYLAQRFLIFRDKKGGAGSGEVRIQHE